MFEHFFAQNAVKVATLSVPILLLLVIGVAYLVIPAKLQGEQQRAFRKISYQIYGQLIAMFLLPAILLVASAKTLDLSFVVGDALPAIAFLAALAVIWDSRATHSEIKEAMAKVGSKRAAQLDFIGRTNLLIAVFALLLLIVAGSILAAQYFKLVEPLPSWLWFISFWVTAPAILCMAVSKSLSFIAGQWNR